MTSREASEVVDARGKPCPLPVIMLARSIKVVEAGDVIELLADDPGSPADVSAWCRMTGHELVTSLDAGDHTRFRVRRSG